MIRLISPDNGAEVLLLTQPQREFRGRRGGGGWFDWLNLKRSDSEDGTKPVRVGFSWEGDADEFTFELSESASFEQTYTVCTSDKKTEVCNLKMNCTYYWRVNDCECFSFHTEDAAPRWIDVDGVSNVRDMGAWRTADGRRIRQGLIYRGGELDTHMTITEQGLCTMRNQLGIHTDLDVRGEAVGKISESPLGPDVDFLLIPARAYDEFFREDHRETVRRIFSLLADEKNYPIYFHCWGGADRTGTIALFIEAVLGVSEADMLMDYELTSLSIWEVRSRETEHFVRFMNALNEWGAPEDSMNKKAVNYLLACGVTDTQLERLRQNLLED